MSDDFTLTKVERLTLINQFRILEALCPDEDVAASYAERRRILEPPFHSEVQHLMWVNAGRIDA